MQRNTIQSLEIFKRSRTFLLRAQPTTALSDLRVHLESLDNVVKRLGALVVDQERHKREGKGSTTTVKEQLRTVRFEYLRPLSRLARTLFADDAALVGVFTVPARERRPAAIVAVARAMAAAAAPRQEQFVTAGFALDFVERLRAAADLLETMTEVKAGEVTRRMACTAGAQQEVKRGRAVLQLVDAMVAPRLVKNKELAMEWRAMLRMGMRGTSGAASAGVEPPAPQGPALPTPAEPTALVAA